MNGALPPLIAPQGELARVSRHIDLCKATVHLFGPSGASAGRVARSAGGSLSTSARDTRGRPKTPLLTGPERGLRAWHGGCHNDMNEPCDALERPARRKSSLALSSSSGWPDNTCHPVWRRASSLRLPSVWFFSIRYRKHLRHADAPPGVDSVTDHQPCGPSWYRRGNHHPDPTGQLGSIFCDTVSYSYYVTMSELQPRAQRTSS